MKFTKTSTKKIVFAGIFIFVFALIFQNCGKFNSALESGEDSSGGAFESASNTSICMFNGLDYLEGSVVSAYRESVPSQGVTCYSQRRECIKGGFTGDYEYSTCDSSDTAKKSCLFDGLNIIDGQKRKAYTSSIGPCQFTYLTCDDGILRDITINNRQDSEDASKLYIYNSCSPGGKQASCKFDGLTVPFNESVDAYQYSSVDYGSSCGGGNKQERVCAEATESTEESSLSGTFINKSCVGPLTIKCSKTDLSEPGNVICELTNGEIPYAGSIVGVWYITKPSAGRSSVGACSNLSLCTYINVADASSIQFESLDVKQKKYISNEINFSVTTESENGTQNPTDKINISCSNIDQKMVCRVDSSLTGRSIASYSWKLALSGFPLESVASCTESNYNGSEEIQCNMPVLEDGTYNVLATVVLSNGGKLVSNELAFSFTPTSSIPPQPELACTESSDSGVAQHNVIYCSIANDLNSLATLAIWKIINKSNPSDSNLALYGERCIGKSSCIWGDGAETLPHGEYEVELVATNNSFQTSFKISVNSQLSNNGTTNESDASVTILLYPANTEDNRITSNGETDLHLGVVQSDKFTVKIETSNVTTCSYSNNSTSDFFDPGKIISFREDSHSQIFSGSDNTPTEIVISKSIQFFCQASEGTLFSNGTLGATFKVDYKIHPKASVGRQFELGYSYNDNVPNYYKHNESRSLSIEMQNVDSCKINETTYPSSITNIDFVTDYNSGTPSTGGSSLSQVNADMECQATATALFETKVVDSTVETFSYPLSYMVSAPSDGKKYCLTSKNHDMIDGPNCSLDSNGRVVAGSICINHATQFMGLKYECFGTDSGNYTAADWSPVSHVSSNQIAPEVYFAEQTIDSASPLIYSLTPEHTSGCSVHSQPQKYFWNYDHASDSIKESYSDIKYNTLLTNETRPIYFNCLANSGFYYESTGKGTTTASSSYTVTPKLASASDGYCIKSQNVRFVSSSDCQISDSGHPSHGAKCVMEAPAEFESLKYECMDTGLWSDISVHNKIATPVRIDPAGPVVLSENESKKVNFVLENAAGCFDIMWVRNYAVLYGWFKTSLRTFKCVANEGYYFASTKNRYEEIVVDLIVTSDAPTTANTCPTKSGYSYSTTPHCTYSSDGKIISNSSCLVESPEEQRGLIYQCSLDGAWLAQSSSNSGDAKIDVTPNEVKTVTSNSTILYSFIRENSLGCIVKGGTVLSYSDLPKEGYSHNVGTQSGSITFQCYANIGHYFPNENDPNNGSSMIEITRNYIVSSTQGEPDPPPATNIICDRPSKYTSFYDDPGCNGGTNSEYPEKSLCLVKDPQIYRGLSIECLNTGVFSEIGMHNQAEATIAISPSVSQSVDVGETIKYDFTRFHSQGCWVTVDGIGLYGVRTTDFSFSPANATSSGKIKFTCQANQGKYFAENNQSQIVIFRSYSANNPSYPGPYATVTITPDGNQSIEVGATIYYNFTLFHSQGCRAFINGVGYGAVKSTGYSYTPQQAASNVTINFLCLANAGKYFSASGDTEKTIDRSFSVSAAPPPPQNSCAILPGVALHNCKYPNEGIATPYGGKVMDTVTCMVLNDTANYKRVGLSYTCSSKTDGGGTWSIASPAAEYCLIPFHNGISVPTSDCGSSGTEVASGAICDVTDVFPTKGNYSCTGNDTWTFVGP